MKFTIYVLVQKCYTKFEKNWNDINQKDTCNIINGRGTTQTQTNSNLLSDTRDLEKRTAPEG